MKRRGQRSQELDRVSGEIVDWVNQPLADSGWHVATLRLPDGELLQITGTHHPRVGCSLRAEGYYDTHPRYGRRFVVSRAEHALPESSEGFVRWLCDLKVGVGEVRARALLASFDSLETLYRVIVHSPAELTAVQGVTESIAQKLSQAVREQGDEAKYRIKLRGYGLTQNQIKHCLDAWETLEATCVRIEADPFCLAFHVDGFGFKRADEVRLSMKIPHEHMSRLCAGTLFALSEHAEDGNTFGGRAFVARTAREMLQVHDSLVWPAVQRLDADGRLVLDNRRAYLPSLLTAETLAVGDPHPREERTEQTDVYGSDGRDDYGRRDPDRDWTAEECARDRDFEV